jgi:hypothetical protein
MKDDIEILKNEKAFKKVEYLKNHTAHEAREAHNRAARRFDEIQKDLYKYV